MAIRLGKESKDYLDMYQQYFLQEQNRFPQELGSVLCVGQILVAI